MELTKLCRCDRCGAEAKSVFTNGDELVLMFCGHHTDKYLPGLLGQGFVDVVSEDAVAV